MNCFELSVRPSVCLVCQSHHKRIKACSARQSHPTGHRQVLWSQPATQNDRTQQGINTRSGRNTTQAAAPRITDCNTMHHRRAQRAVAACGEWRRARRGEPRARAVRGRGDGALRAAAARVRRGGGGDGQLRATEQQGGGGVCMNTGRPRCTPHTLHACHTRYTRASAACMHMHGAHGARCMLHMLHAPTRRCRRAWTSSHGALGTPSTPRYTYYTY